MNRNVQVGLCIGYSGRAYKAMEWKDSNVDVCDYTYQKDQGVNEYCNRVWSHREAQQHDDNENRLADFQSKWHEIKRKEAVQEWMNSR